MRVIVLSFTALVLMAAFTPMHAALDFFIQIKGVEGGSTQAGREGWIECQTFDWGMSVPMSTRDGKPTGKRQHRPIRFVKELDKATPLLMTACSSGEVYEDMVIEFEQPSRDGKQVTYIRYELTNVQITSYSMHSSSDDASVPAREQIEVTYESLSVTWVEGGDKHVDDWIPTR